MADQSVHDVVKQSQSVDALRPTDVSVTNNAVSAALAAADDSAPYGSDTKQTYLPQPTENDETSQHIAADVGSVAPYSQFIGEDGDSLPAEHPGQVNGVFNESQELESYENGSVRSGGIEGSAGSDTDMSKAEAGGNIGKDAEGRDSIPRYAAKKTSSFKPMTATKNFLMKAGSTSLPKSGSEKGSSSPSSPGPGSSLLGGRPRLVAKTGSNQRSTPKSLSMNKNGKSGGPDPNQVWNRNRVQTPQATPKQMTDEELRQQYGIQLASRPDDSGDGKEAKWADIDDDEEDWAPDTIEWNDGTKISLAQVDSSTPTTEQLSILEKPKEVQQPEPTEPKSATPKAISMGPKATVLKLGASTQPKLFPTIEPLASTSKPTNEKTTGEKPTLVAKPSPAPPPKNPWAPLPPVDKFSPVTPPVQQPQPRFGQWDPQSYESMPPPPQPIPAQEIAADDFSRLPRETSNGRPQGPRELYNSQSGRYEPVPDGRRLPKKDQGFRAPSVLQRPSQADVYSPAEPSPAFQTNRSQQDASQWRRRRASSTISGENGAFGRRMSMNKGPIDGLQRRESQLEQPLTPSVSSAMPSQRDASPTISHGQSAASQSPAVSNVQVVPQDQNSAAQVPQTPMTPGTPSGHLLEEVKMQKSLMKEKAEAAHKRRLEEEQRQEAEKRERLRLKMEKLGLTDEKLGKKPADEIVAPPSKVILKDNKDSPTSTPPVPATKAVSPPKPPVPAVNGEPQQYGLMKLHAPQVVTPASPNFEKEKKSSSPPGILQETRQEAQPSTITATIATSTIPTHPLPTSGEQAPIGPPTDPEKPVEHYLPQRLTPAPPPSTNGYPAWGQHSMATHSSPGGNVWAAPPNHKGLGNGDFQKRVHVAPVQQPYPPQHLVSPQPPPQPIGTPRQTPHNKPPASEPPIVSLPRHVDASHPQTLSFGSNSENLSSTHLRAHLPHLPPTLDQDLNPPPSVIMPQREIPKTGMALWSDFSNNAAAYDAKQREKMAQEHAAFVAEQQKLGKPLSTGPVLNETWNQITKGENVGARQLVGSVKTHRKFNESETAPAPPVRSRYQDIFDQKERSLHNQVAPVQSSSTSGPPAEVELHPVFGTSQRPVVNLPKVRVLEDPDEAPPRPIVRLPPPKPVSAVGAPAAVEPRLSLSPLRAQPFVANPTWQDRINGLFERKAAPEKKSLDTTDFSVSKPAMELFPVGSTSVTLPPNETKLSFQAEVPLKSVEEEDALFEEGREFGSVPPVRIPANAPPEAWNPAKPYTNYKRMKIMALNDSSIYSGFNFIPGFDDLARHGDIPVVIKLAGMPAPKNKMLARTANFKQARQPYNSTRGKSRYGHKGKEQSSPLTSTAPGQLNTGRQNGQQSGGQRKPSSNAGQSWARRVSGMVQ